MKVVINCCFGGFSLSAEAERVLIETLGEKCSYRYELERHNPVLVSLVEKMGEGANGMCANLDVVEIPDGLDYDIEEYDGYESTREYITVTSEELKNGLSEEKLALLKYTNEIKVYN